MEAHNGRVELKSELNKGSEFIIYLPACTDKGKQLKTETASSSTSESEFLQEWIHTVDQDQDQKNLPEHETEAKGTTEERTTQTIWHSTYKLPVRIIEPRKTTEFEYDGNGNLTTRTEIDTVTGICSTDNSKPQCRRTVRRTYNAQQQLESIDGPRNDVNDVTRYTYDQQGNRTHIINALNHTTIITSYDAYGNPQSIVEPSGVITTLSYDSRQRLIERTIAAGTNEEATTAFEYDAFGNLNKVILANGNFMEYAYDNAQRLISISDSYHNQISYILDKAGNRQTEDIRDHNGVLLKTQSHIFDELSRLITHLGAENQETAFVYDGNNNQIQITLPSGAVTKQNFDALNRLVKTIDPENGESKPTNYSYDEQGNLVNVTDPNDQSTHYVYNGFGDVIEQASPNTGIATFTYDAAGNRISQTDARGITVHYTYDALNRLMSIDYPGTQEDVHYQYDQLGSTTNQNNIGRLSRIDDHSGTTEYVYDKRGNIINVYTLLQVNSQQRSFSTGYTYDTADNLIKITYPSGRTVDYDYNSVSRIERVTTKYLNQTRVLANNIHYQPFGPLTGFTYGNGLQHQRNYDLDQRLIAHSSDQIQSRSLSYDLNSNINEINDVLHAQQNKTFSYDLLDRLKPVYSR